MPTTVLFVSANAGGNAPPTYAVARAIANRGARVVFAGLRPPDEAWEHVPLPAIEGKDPGTASSGGAELRALIRMGMSQTLARQAAEAISRIEPDVIVVDAVMISSLRAAERSGRPVAALFHTFGAYWVAGFKGPGKLLDLLGIGPGRAWSRADARLLFTDRELDPLRDDDDPVGFEWMGTTERAVAQPHREADAPPLVLVSLSSAWQKDQDAVYQRIITALGTLPVRAIVTRAAPKTPFEGTIPPNVSVRGRSSHADLFGSVSLVIGHGGHSTTLGALANGIPLLVLPLNRSSDQPMIGRIVEDAGLGLTLAQTAPSEAIAAAVQRILASDDMRQAAADTAHRISKQDGAEVAADRIEALARG